MNASFWEPAECKVKERIGFWTAAIRQWWTSILSMCIQQGVNSNSFKPCFYTGQSFSSTVAHVPISKLGFWWVGTAGDAPEYHRRDGSGSLVEQEVFFTIAVVC
jgi:hypothetical protein